MITDPSQSGKVLLPVQQGHLARLEDGLDFVNTLHFSCSLKHAEELDVVENDFEGDRAS